MLHRKLITSALMAALYSLSAPALCMLTASCSPQDVQKPEPAPEPEPEPEPGPEPQKTWHFSGGAGTEDEPFLIATPTDIDSLSIYSNGADASMFTSACYLQTADIEMAGRNFTPIAYAGVFSGTYDGDGHAIKGLSITVQEEKPSGFISSCSGAYLKNICLKNVSTDTGWAYSGALAGKAYESTIQNCHISGKVRQYTRDITIDGIENCGYSGGLLGRIENCTVKSCTLDADVTIFGKYSGGMIGHAIGSTITDCHVTKNHTINVWYHVAGGIVGKAEGSATNISACSFQSNLSNVGYILGGIVGEITGGCVEKCVLGSYADVGSDKYYAGGIAGIAKAESAILIEKCACYGRVKGQYAVGGIVGSTEASESISIRSCATVGSEITATGYYAASSPNSLLGGICGWTKGRGRTEISGCYTAGTLLQTIAYGNQGALGGISGYQNCTGTTTYSNCYTTVTPPSMLNRGEKITDITGTCYYGAIFARCTKPTEISACFYDESLSIGPEKNATLSGNRALATSALSDGTLLGLLQASSDGTQWVAGSNGLPTIQGLPEDPEVKPRASKRVSIIGDSISTYKGWVVSGYSTHYPTSDGVLTMVKDTYWYKLIYELLEGCEFDTNISFSSSTVTNTTYERYAAVYGPDKRTWFGRSFTTRFEECGGVGRPDIILIHGGTNDWAHNTDELAPGVPIRNDADNIYGGSAPSAEIMEGIFYAADAAATRAEVNALPDETFCEAYTKLLCQIRERYPACKVVCIIGDYVNTAIEGSIQLMADHYGAKTVNLLRVNGFNDLGGYSLEGFTNKGTQPNMPKHDYKGDVGGAHPGPEAMKFMAEKIYTELGTWLQE